MGARVDTAKPFRSGRSQAVRLPKAFRCEGNGVRIQRQGQAIIFEPISNDWAWLDVLTGSIGLDFEEAVGEEIRPELGFFE